jgi:hypothetical protein
VARTADGTDLTRRHYRAQLQLRGQALQAFLSLWPMWSGDRASFERLIDATVPLVTAHHQLSASMARAYFGAFRKAEDVGGAAAARPADQLDVKAVRKSLYVTGEVMTTKALAAGMTPQAAMDAALTRTSGAVGRHVMNGGRNTLMRSVESDRTAEGWSRVTSSNPCHFCAMLASRGPAYTSEDTADFKAHDHCSCGVEPHYPGAEWPGRGREFQALWQEHAKGAEDPVNAFRRVLEGRV